jgi:hypothetical protein
MGVSGHELNDAGEKAVLHQVLSRFDQQIEVIDTG